MNVEEDVRKFLKEGLPERLGNYLDLVGELTERQAEIAYGVFASIAPQGLAMQPFRIVVDVMDDFVQSSPDETLRQPDGYFDVSAAAFTLVRWLLEKDLVIDLSGSRIEMVLEGTQFRFRHDLQSMAKTYGFLADLGEFVRDDEATISGFRETSYHLAHYHLF